MTKPRIEKADTRTFSIAFVGKGSKPTNCDAEVLKVEWARANSVARISSNEAERQQILEWVETAEPGDYLVFFDHLISCVRKGTLTDVKTVQVFNNKEITLPLIDEKE